MRSVFVQISAAAAAAAREVAARDHPAAYQDEAEDHADRMEVRRQSALPAQCIAAVRTAHLVVLAVVVARALLRALARQWVAGVRQRAMSWRGVYDRRRARRCHAAKPWNCERERQRAYQRSVQRHGSSRHGGGPGSSRGGDPATRASCCSVGTHARRSARAHATCDRNATQRPPHVARTAPPRCQSKAPPPMTGPASR